MTGRELRAFLEGRDDEALFAEADRVRRSRFGDEVHLRGIVEFSNHCDKTCRYCGLRAGNGRLDRYRLDREEILAAASLAPELGLGTVVLQSGDDFHYSALELGGIVGEIKERFKVAVTLSLGDRPLDDYRHLFDCGADRALLKMETLDRELHERVRPGQSFAARLDRVRGLGEIGFEVGSGIITGLPGLTLDILALDILRVTELELHMISAGPFVANPDTPMAGAPDGDLATAHRAAALLRILNPLANMPATSSLEVLAPGARAEGLAKGLNVVMPSLTPERVRQGYAIYPGKNMTETPVRARVLAIKDEIRRAGFRPSPGPGVSPLFTRSARAARRPHGR
jgi:biotin synthase